MRLDITTVRIEKPPNRTQRPAFAFQEPLEEELFAGSPVVNEVVLGVLSRCEIQNSVAMLEVCWD
jgi:hypothetical protein